MKRTIMLCLAIFVYVSVTSVAQTGKPQYLIETQRADTVLGLITIELFPTIAPLHAAYYDSLVNINFFDTTAFHRVVPDFVIQGGDPNSRHGDKNSWGEGDPAQKNIPAEFTNVSHNRGIIGAARDENINSASSQFYINLVDNTFLNKNYTAFGRVTEGMDVVDFISLVPRDVNDNPLEKIEMFITKLGINTEQINPPQLVSPINGTDAVTISQKLEWMPVDGALLYNVEVSTSPEFTDYFYRDSVSINVATITNLEPGLVNYYWRIKSNNGGNLSEYSEIRNFVTTIAAPGLVSPEDNSMDVQLKPQFKWNKVLTAISYRLQVATKPTFSSSSVVADINDITDTTYTADSLSLNTLYYWRVRGNTNTYEGPKSTIWKFTTKQITDVEENSILPQIYSLSQNYPNPFNPVTTIKYELPEDGFVQLLIYDLLGNKIKTLVNSRHNAGRFQVLFDGSALPSGVYFYRLFTDRFSATRKLLLMK